MVAYDSKTGNKGRWDSAEAAWDSFLNTAEDSSNLDRRHRKEEGIFRHRKEEGIFRHRTEKEEGNSKSHHHRSWEEKEAEDMR